MDTEPTWTPSIDPRLDRNGVYRGLVKRFDIDIDELEKDLFVIVVETERHGVAPAEIVAHHICEQFFNHEVDAKNRACVKLVLVRERLQECKDLVE